MSDFIDDGYTEPGFIAAEEGAHGPLTFSYRPLLAQVRDELSAMVSGDRPDIRGFVNRVAEELEKNVKTWSLADRKESLVPITAENIKKVRPRLLDKLYGVVSGMRRSDDGRQPADLEADAKNS